MREWNVVVTSLPGRLHAHALLERLAAWGDFRTSGFDDVCVGQVANLDAFFDALRAADAEGAAWMHDIGRIIPVERAFYFVPGTLSYQFDEAIAPMLERVGGGTFYLRLDRRGHAGEIDSQRVERELADRVLVLARRRGKNLRTSFEDPDYVIVVEIVGDECGVGLITRGLRRSCRLVHPH